MTRGARIAGAVLVGNGLALLIEKGLAVSTAAFSSPISTLLDLVLGGMLLAGNPKALAWAKLRVVLGGLILPALYLARGETLLATLQLALSGGVALLLFGDPGRLRIGSGLLAAGLALAVEGVGLIGLATGTSPLASLQLAASVEGGPVEALEGVACPWRLTAGGGNWYLRSAQTAKRDNPLADRWLVWPAKDAHVLVVAERVDPGVTVDMDKFAQAVLDNMRGTAPDIRLIERQPLHAGGTMLHAAGTADGLAIEYYYGLFAAEPWIFQVVAFTGQRQFASVSADLRSIIDSFEAPRR